MKTLLKTDNKKFYPKSFKEKIESFSGGITSNSQRHLFLVSFSINFISAMILYFGFFIGNGDAVSRSAHAYYVLFSREPSLAAIGFVWPPLPSLIQIPIIPIFNWLGHPSLAGPFISSLFGALSLVVFNLILDKLETPKRYRLIFLLLLQFNILFLFLSSIGMAEPIALCLVLAAIWGYLEIDKRTRSWVICGLSLGFAFFVRYEAIALTAGVIIAVMIYELGQNNNWKVELEGRLLVLLVPLVYSVMLWMFFNWTIMDDATYFLTSVYSLSNAPDIARIYGIAHPYFLAWNNILEAINIAIKRIWSQSPLFMIAFIPTFWVSLKQKNFRFVGLLIILISIPMFTTLQVFLGSLASWFRYWFYVIPFGFILAGMLYKMLNDHHGAKLIFWGAILLSVASYQLSLSAMKMDDVGRDEQRIRAVLVGDFARNQQIKSQDGYWIFRHDAPIVAQALDQFSENGLVLVDASRGYNNIMEAKYPERLFISSDLDFFNALENPAEYVRFILLLDPKDSDGLNVFAMVWPELVDGDVPWASLVWESQDTLASWRIFEIKSSPVD